MIDIENLPVIVQAIVVEAEVRKIIVIKKEETIAEVILVSIF